VFCTEASVLMSDPLSAVTSTDCHDAVKNVSYLYSMWSPSVLWRSRKGIRPVKLE